jgi:hypothetical protein
LHYVELDEVGILEDCAGARRLGLGRRR